MTDERSPGGSEIHRHQARDRPFEAAIGDEALLATVEAHVEAHLGPIASVYHEIVSELVHVDVLQVAPAGDRPHWTLVTCGMAARPMSPPPGAEDERFSELVMSVPGDWPLEQRPWPLGLLQFLARLPHEYETWLSVGHTVPNGDPPEPFAPGTGLCGVILAPPLLTPDGFERIERPEGDIAVNAVVALHADEMELKLDEGADALWERLQDARVSERLDVDRPSVAPPKRRRFGLRRR